MIAILQGEQEQSGEEKRGMVPAEKPSQRQCYAKNVILGSESKQDSAE